MYLDENDKSLESFLSKLKPQALFYERSDEEKRAHAELLKEKLVMFKLRRWGQGALAILILEAFVALIFLILGMGK